MFKKIKICMLLVAIVETQIQASESTAAPILTSTTSSVANAHVPSSNQPVINLTIKQPSQNWSSFFLQPQVIFGIGSSIVALGGTLWTYHELTRARRNEKQLQELHAKVDKLKEDTTTLINGQKNILADTSTLKEQQGKHGESMLALNDRVGRFEGRTDQQLKSVNDKLDVVQKAQQEAHSHLAALASDQVDMRNIVARTHTLLSGEIVPDKGHTSAPIWQKIGKNALSNFFPMVGLLRASSSTAAITQRVSTDHQSGHH